MSLAPLPQSSVEAFRSAKILRILGGTRGKRILDLGCGSGKFSRVLSARNEVFALDLDDYSQCFEGTGVIFLRHDLNEPLPFPDKFFDVALASEVLEHLANVEGVLSEIRRTLKPGGWFVGSVPSGAWNVLADAIGLLHPFYRSFETRFGGQFGARSKTLSLIECYLQKAWRIKASHIHRRGWRWWRELLEKHGFVLMRAIGSHFFPLTPFLPRSVQGRILSHEGKLDDNALARHLSVSMIFHCVCR